LCGQGFFHDVTWTHKLRDSPNELYKFEESRLDAAEQNIPVGIFTLLTDCYSPTCSSNRICYSISCPRRFEQQNQLVSPVAAERQLVKPAQLWSSSVPPEILESVTKMEQTRQEVIFEIIQTEKDFVNDLKNMIEVDFNLI
jgi:RHO1 GDP-GTP exchange protein 1/2